MFNEFNCQVYRLLVETYGSAEGLRDYSGHTAPFYLENHIQVTENFVGSGSFCKIHFRHKNYNQELSQ